MYTSFYKKCLAVAEMGDRLATVDMDRNWGTVHLWGRAAGSPYHNVTRAKAYLPTKWHLDPSSRLATTGMGRKLGAVPLWGG